MLREGKGNLRLVIPGIPGNPGNPGECIKSKVIFKILFILCPDKLSATKTDTF